MSSTTSSGAPVPDPETDPFAPDDLDAHLIAEAALLGAMLLSPAARTGIVEDVGADDFDREAHRTMFEVLAVMDLEVGHVDHVTVIAELARRGKLDEVGGMVAVFDLTNPDACPAPSAWRCY